MKITFLLLTAVIVAACGKSNTKTTLTTTLSLKVSNFRLPLLMWTH